MADITFTCVILDATRSDELFSSFCKYFDEEIVNEKIILDYNVDVSDTESQIAVIGDVSKMESTPGTFVLGINISNIDWEPGELSGLLEKIKLVQTYPEHCFEDDGNLLESSGSYISIEHINIDEFHLEEIMQFLLDSHNTSIFQHHISSIRLSALESRMNQLIEANNQAMRAISGIKAQQYNETKFAGKLPELLEEMCIELGLHTLYKEMTSEILTEH